MHSRFLKTMILVAAADAMWTHMGLVTSRLTRRRLSWRCVFLGHEDWIRRTSDRLYLECFECGRETQGWTTGTNHQTDRAGGTVQSEPVNRRDDQSAPGFVRSPLKQRPRSEHSIGEHSDMTIAA